MLLPTATLLSEPKEKEQSVKEETEDDVGLTNNDPSQSVEVDGTDHKDKVENEADPKNGSGECSNGARDLETMETSTDEEVFKVKKDDIIAQVHCTNVHVVVLYGAINNYIN